MNPRNISFSLVFSARDPLFKLSLPPLFFQKEKAPYLSNKTTKNPPPFSAQQPLFKDPKPLVFILQHGLYLMFFCLSCSLPKISHMPTLFSRGRTSILVLFSGLMAQEIVCGLLSVHECPNGHETC